LEEEYDEEVGSVTSVGDIDGVEGLLETIGIASPRSEGKPVVVVAT
jgi:hypothetical protein